MPSRSLKAAIDLRARRICARWPAIVASSSIALSSAFVSVFASPTPMFRVIFVTFGTCITEDRPSCSFSCGRSSFRYRSFRRGAYPLPFSVTHLSSSPPQPCRLQTRTFTACPSSP